MGLFGPVWLKKNPAKALKGVRKLKDQRKLFRAAKEAVDLDVREAAITGLTDLLSPEMKSPALFARLFLVGMSCVLGIYGYIFGVIIILIHVLSIESFGVPYASFLGTLRLRDLRDTVVRLPFDILGNKDRNTIKELGADEGGGDF